MRFTYWFCIGKGYKDSEPEKTFNFSTVLEIRNANDANVPLTPSNMFDECITNIKEHFKFDKVLITTFDRKTLH